METSAKLAIALKYFGIKCREFSGEILIEIFVFN